MIVLHRHHVIPRHAGGTNDPSNLVLLTVPEHAEAHRLLWEEHGRLQDKVAWLMLSGKTDEGELARIELTRQLNTGRKHSAETRLKLRATHLGKPNNCTGTKRSPESREKMRLAQQRVWADPAHREHMREVYRGKVASLETRLKMSASSRAAYTEGRRSLHRSAEESLATLAATLAVLA